MPQGIQRMLAAAALIPTAPILLLLAALVKLDSRGPALYRARRVGRDGDFLCLKLRTMAVQPVGTGPGITVDRDPRVTRVGRLLRRHRLDELPQLVNVVRGEMNLVGPRPEDPRFVDETDPLHRFVFGATPGITGLTQLAFVDEPRLMRTAPGDPEQIYRKAILPRKVALDAAYLRARSWRLDLWILWQTVRSLLGHPVRLPATMAGDAAPWAVEA